MALRRTTILSSAHTAVNMYLLYMYVKSMPSQFGVHCLKTELFNMLFWKAVDKARCILLL